MKQSKKLLSFSKMVQNFDLFGANVQFRENGNESLKTNFGAFISIVILTTVTIYAINKCNILVQRADTLNSEYIETDGVP